MSLIKSSMALVGLVACLFSYLPVATAASFDKYLVAPLGTVSAPGAFTPFLVKASDSDTPMYLIFDYGPDFAPPQVGLSHDVTLSPGALFLGKWVGRFYSQLNSSKIIWMPFRTESNPTHDPHMEVFLTEEQGLDEHGDVKLMTNIILDCDAFQSYCFPTQKIS